MSITLKLLKYEVDFFTVDTSQYVGGTPANGWTFTNLGTSVAYIETITLQPGQSFEIGGNTGEITEQRFFVNFKTSTTGNNVVVLRKRYLSI